MPDRTIILHYHLFKNAGTSVDKILKDNFPGRWVTAEFPPMGGNNTPLVEDWIRDNPEAVAFSSHTMLGPIPAIEGVEVISLMLLRDPIARLHSAYRFERQQDADTFGARLAKETDFEGYVRARLEIPGDRQCRNFQTARLASLVPGSEPELDRAKAAMNALSIIGRVEAFDVFLADLKAQVAGAFPDFDTGEGVRMNVSKPEEDRPDDTQLRRLLSDHNKGDLQLLQALTQDA